MARVGVGVLALELARDQSHFRLGVLQGDPCLQARNAPVLVNAPELQRLRAQPDWQKQLAFGREGKPEISRQDADDGGRLAIHLDGPSEHADVCAETPLPVTVGQNSHLVPAGMFLIAAERAAEQGPHAEDFEEARRNATAGDPFGIAVAGDAVLCGVVHRHCGEAVRQTLPVQKVRRSDRTASLVFVRPLLPQRHDAARLGIRQRAEKGGVHHAEHRGVGTDPQRQGQQRHDGEAAGFGERTRAVTQVLQKGEHRRCGA